MLGSDDSTKKEIDLRKQKEKKTKEYRRESSDRHLRSITGGLHTNGLATLGIPFAKINSNTFQLDSVRFSYPPIELVVHITARG